MVDAQQVSTLAGGQAGRQGKAGRGQAPNTQRSLSLSLTLEVVALGRALPLPVHLEGGDGEEADELVDGVLLACGVESGGMRAGRGFSEWWRRAVGPAGAGNSKAPAPPTPPPSRSALAGLPSSPPATHAPTQ